MKILNIVVLWLYNYDGSKLINTGLQRWCRDIALLAEDAGYTVTIYQKASQHFEVNLTDKTRIIGIKCPLSFRGNYSVSNWLNKNVDTSEPFVFVSKEMYFSNKIQRAVGIDHGIWWDGDYPRHRKWMIKRFQYRLLHSFRGTICVDTNFINWCHTELPDRSKWQHKLTYIPNYADTDRFTIHPNQSLPDVTERPLIILFPRRIEGNDLENNIRGAGFFLKAVDILRKNTPNIQIHMVGESVHNSAIAKWAAQRNFEGRIETYNVGMDDMPSVYLKADVVVVPTLAHEGTSLSAVESIVSGKSTVVTHIGGLGNIIIPGLNGYICDLTPESLADAILEASKYNPLKNLSVLENCRQSLGKKRWDRQVWSYLSQNLELC